MAIHDPATAALAALDRFIETFNSRDKHAWAQSLQYPHVRISPRARPAVSPNARAYADAFTYDATLAMGWDHSEWDERRVLQVSADKVHAAGQWCRYDPAGARILPNAVVYVVTRVGDHWGIQARFGTDSPPTDSTGEARTALERFLAALGGRAGSDLEASVHLPLLEIDPGAVREWRDVETSRRLAADRPRLEVEALEAIQAGEAGVNFAADLREAETGRPRQGVLLVTRRDERWGVQAVSLLP